MGDDDLLARVATGLAGGLAYGVALVGADLTIEWASPGMEAMLGAASGSLTNVFPGDIVHPDDFGLLLTLAAAELDHASPFGRDPAQLTTNTIRLRHADGRWVPFEMAANSMVDDPFVRGWVLMLRDATGDELRTEVLRSLTSDTPLRHVLGAAADLLAWQVRGATVEISAIDSYGERLDVQRGGVAPDRGADVLRRHDDGEAGPTTLRVWLPSATATGPTAWCHTLVERAMRFVTLAVERERWRAQKSAADAHSRLIERMETLGRIAAGLAHELNNQLTVVSGHLDLLAPGSDPAGAVHVATIHQAIARSSEIVQRLLEAGNQESLAVEPIELLSFVRERLDLLTALVAPPGCVHDDLGAAPVHISADPGKLHDVLVELVTNASRALGAAGTVTLRLERIVITRPRPSLPGLEPGAYAALTVADDGVGMPADVLSRATEPFFTTQHHRPASGLGLAWALGVTRRWGGHLSIDSVAGTGTTATVYLPER